MPRRRPPNFDAVQIKTIKVAQNIYVLEGEGRQTIWRGTL